MARDVASRRHHWYPAVALVLLNLSALQAGERWSRQLTDYSHVPGNDWIPLARPGERQAGAKVLNYFDQTSFLDNSAQPQHHQFSYQQFPPQSSRLVFPPPPQQQQVQQQQDLDAVFNQQFNHQNFFQQHQQTQFGGGIQTIQRHPLPPYSPQLPKESLVHEKPSVVEQPFQFGQPAGPRQPTQQANGGVSQEEVQLLYVPVETLYNQKQPAPDTSRFNPLPQPVSASLINDFYTAATTTSKPRTTQTPYTTKSTTKATVKPKPNQPPLAMFMYNDDKSKISITDALGNLKNVGQISVLDSLSKNLPKVFIGPSGLAPPKGYSKFELPYLSTIEQNRFDRKLNDLPFFVAPLSYKTPSGFSKIPLPSPHVGSVIVQQSTASSQTNNYYRQPDNIEYYQPATLKFSDISTKPPITLPSAKPQQYEPDHYTSPTAKPTTDRITYSRGNTQSPQETYRQPQTYNSLSNLPNRHIVNEEYFNLAKTKKPAVQTTVSNYTPKTYKPFEFKPIPEQQYPEPEDQTPVFTTPKPATTTERLPTTRQEESRMKAFFKEENFRNRRPYTPSTLPPTYEEEDSPNNNQEQEQRFVHKFKLVDSVRPQTTSTTKSVIDNAFLDFFNQDGNQQNEMVKTVVSNTANNNAGQQIIRNNYFTSNANEAEPPKQKFVSTYFAPTTSGTSTTARATTTTSTVAPQTDAFFRDFDEKSRFASRPAVENQEAFINRYTESSYVNKYKYETNTNEAHYPVEVVTTQDPIRHDEVTTASPDQSYNIPSELPPISANLPGLVNSLMEDEWAQKKGGEQDSPTSTTTRTNFRKQQSYRTTPAPTTQEPYVSEVTTRRTRGRRPTASTTTHSDAPAPTRGSVNRSRSRYVASDGEKPSRGRVRSRVQVNPRVTKEDDNLEYQRDVLKQNYPIIRPTAGQSTTQTTTTTTTTTPPPPTTTTTTTQATTMPITYQQIYEEQTERLYPYPSTDPVDQEEVSIPRKEYSYNENYYEPEVTSTYPQTTPRRVVQYQTPAQQIDEESVRVLPVDYQPEPQREVIREQQPVYNLRRQPAKQPAEEAPVTSDEIPKVEITPRPRRPGLSRQQVYSPRTTAATERATTTTTTEVGASRGGSQQRRPAFVRRPARPLYTTTSAPPTTTYASRGYAPGGSDDEQPTQGTATVRPKSRQDILRARTRRPVTTTAAAATTTTASPEPSVTRGFARNKELRRVSPTTRSRQEQREREPQQQQTQQQADSTSTPRFRIRERTRFNLQPQESQWSTKLNQNSFQPVQDVESRHKTYGDEELPQNEPEIVTASALLNQEEEDGEGQISNIHLINVSAKMGGPVAATGTPGLIMNEVALSQAPPQAEDNADNSNAPSFAELLNDVMKEFIDEDVQQAGTEGKTVENEILIEEVPSSTTESQRRRNVGSGGRAGGNFRKRGRSHAVESFETAESQHINSHVYNSAGFEQLKNIDKAYLHGKNFAEEAKGASEIEENNAQEATTAGPAPQPQEEPIVTIQPEVTTSSISETTPLPETTSVLPVEHETVTPAPTPVEEDDGHSAEQFYDDEPTPEQTDPSQGIFADVKRQISDLFAMAENDPETEEIEEDDQQYQPSAPMASSTDEPELATTVNLTTTTTTTTDMTPEENQFEPVTESVPNAMPIPTSTSNGITHETEICYRGRCVKTDEKKPKKSKFKPN
ncbi:mucin-5AC [Culex pipiens pallens]|uniref:mucin-5AC n=1 Tax=Culex pipiens pallens TaxID=42434 RepID=UPI001953ED29|nr:mucin-5AC [Culex pipiens pallens]